MERRFFLAQNLPPLIDLCHRSGCLAHALHRVEMLNVSLLALLVVGEATFELAMFLLVRLRGRFGGGEMIRDRFAASFELSEARAQRPDPSVQPIDHIVIGLQREQSLEILMHSRPPCHVRAASLRRLVMHTRTGLRAHVVRG
jgi:hypothetical protein